MMTSVQLHQHPGLGHPLAAKPVLRRAPATGTADARPGENAPHRGPAQVDAFPLTEQLGEVGVVGAFVTLRRQLQHGRSLARRSGVVGTATAVAVGQRGGASSRRAWRGVTPSSSAASAMGTWYSKTELSTESLACSF